jgi:hypothetical protein
MSLRPAGALTSVPRLTAVRCTDARGTVSELLGADTDVLDRHAESLSTDARRVQDIRLLARRAMAELQASWNGFDLARLTQLWEQQASPLLAGASASLDTCSALLRAQSAAQRVTSSDDGGTFKSTTRGDTYGGSATTPVPAPPPVSPPRRGSPAGNATWWKALSELQQQQVIRLHPDWIGNRDGVAFAARDQANRARLPLGHHRIAAEVKRLEASLAADWSGDFGSTEITVLDEVRAKLASIEVVETMLVPENHDDGSRVAGPDRQLVLLDLDQSRAEAAIARGNIDTADNVAVFVPGFSSTVNGSMKSYDADMGLLQQRAETESANANAHRSAATVAWIGYQAPQGGLGLVGANSVLGYHAATNGAARLVPFLQGIGTARDRDAHLTLLGHSYGSTTAGVALRQDTGVDDAVFFGSPGLGTDDVGDLTLAAGPSSGGHLHYIEAKWDGIGDLGRFGTDPTQLAGIDHASALESTVVDPLTGAVRHLDGATGHSAYLSDGSTSQYNLSVVVAGVPDQIVHGEGNGLGDAVRWATGTSLAGTALAAGPLPSAGTVLAAWPLPPAGTLAGAMMIP